MNTILIATDFSPASKNAASYGVQLAKEMKAKVILFTAYEVARPLAALNVQVSAFDTRMQMQKKLADEAESLSDNTITIEVECEEGKSHEAILAIGVEKRVDLIIVGMKGSGGSLQRLLGSTAVSLIKNISIPVIIVPRSAGFRKIKNMIYASDVFLDVTISAIDQVKWLTDYFKPELFVVRVVKDNYEEVRERVNTPHTLRKELKFLSTSFSFPVDTNTTAALSEFIGQHIVDLVIMLPHQHEWLERLFAKSETKEMAFHGVVPILMLPMLKVKNTDTANFEAIEQW